jgi:hypothetical protein
MDSEWVVIISDNGVFMNSRVFIKEAAAIDYMTEISEQFPGYEYEIREIPAKAQQNDTEDSI